MKKSWGKISNKISNYFKNNSLADIIKIIKKFSENQIFILFNFVCIPVYATIITILLLFNTSVILLSQDNR